MWSVTANATTCPVCDDEVYLVVVRRDHHRDKVMIASGWVSQSWDRISIVHHVHVCRRVGSLPPTPAETVNRNHPPRKRGFRDVILGLASRIFRQAKAKGSV